MGLVLSTHLREGGRRVGERGEEGGEEGGEMRCVELRQHRLKRQERDKGDKEERASWRKVWIELNRGVCVCLFSQWATH